jgi:CHAT domain-containing protein
LNYGRALSDLADVEARLGEDQAAVETARRAAEILRPRVSPADALRAARRLARLHEERGDWRAAATAYADALEALDLAYFGRAAAADRARELQGAWNLGRWAAFAFAKSGDLRRAVEVLEDTRTRELRRRLGFDGAVLRELAAQSRPAHDDLLAAAERLRAAALGDDADATAADYDRALRRVRSLPGFERFATSVSWPEIEQAVEFGRPLIYINPTPHGTLLLSLRRPRRGEPADVTAMTLPVTSAQITERVMMGLDDDREQTGVSYLAALMAPEGPIGDGLDFVLPWVGERVMAPLTATLKDHEHAVVLTVSGPLATVPLHAARWGTGTDALVVADRAAVTYAPSAILHGASLRRLAAQPSDSPWLVAVADPEPLTDPLPGSRTEVAEITRHFGEDHRHIATGDSATVAFVSTYAPTASFLHLACHASGDLLDHDASFVALADGDLPLARLAALGGFAARLTVLSACESGVSDITDAADEAYSMASVALASGSAAVIASLWPVDDYATALLMTRLYEVLFAEPGLRPTDALHAAQSWLRSLTDAEHDEYVAAHPQLASERARRRGGNSTATIQDEVERSFRDPVLWAPFIAMGA